MTKGRSGIEISVITARSTYDLAGLSNLVAPCRTPHDYLCVSELAYDTRLGSSESMALQKVVNSALHHS